MFVLLVRGKLRERMPKLSLDQASPKSNHATKVSVRFSIEQHQGSKHDSSRTETARKLELIYSTSQGDRAVQRR